AAGTGPIKSLHRLEAEFRGLGVKVTALRAAYFLENWGGVLPVAKAQGVLPAFIALDRRIPMVATADIGRAAAEALLSPPAEAWRTIELSGAADLSPNDIAAAVSERLGRGVPAVAVPREAWEGTLTGAGLSADAARQFAEMFEGIDSGHVAFDGTGTPQRGATDFKALLGALLG
ncbi:MAG TPA: NAD-dependent dehydratase, partial [Alphaproteobacteria bacterium]|nr:NAD-dependent dehydratase [Alphaproteobacteria bacterium]